jgi:hypothetical protein
MDHPRPRNRSTTLATQTAAEQRMLTGPELDAVTSSRHPIVASLSRAELVALVRLLRDYRDKARGIAARRRREKRGKADPRGATTPDETGVLEKAQFFAGGLKRANARLQDLDNAAKRERAVTGLKAALARKRTARVHHPDAGRTAHDGMAAQDSDRRSVRVDPREVGRVSQAVKVAQAQRDG